MVSLRPGGTLAPPQAPPVTLEHVTLAVFDIDGVVADVTHRLHHLQRAPKDWIGFFRAAAQDSPLPTGLALVADLGQQHDLVWLTGRPGWLRSTTSRWLTDQGLPGGELFMRGDADRRPAPVYKMGVLRRLAERQIAAFVDDDTQVVDAAQRLGYPALLADWAPRAPAMHEAQERLGRT